MTKQLYLIVLTYTKEIAAIDNLMKPHVTYLKKYYKLNKFLVSGRQIPRTGGIILCYADNIEEVEKMASEDPFIKNSVAEYNIIAFKASMSSNAFKTLLESL